MSEVLNEHPDYKGVTIGVGDEDDLNGPTVSRQVAANYRRLVAESGRGWDHFVAEMEKGKTEGHRIAAAFGRKLAELEGKPEVVASSTGPVVKAANGEAKRTADAPAAGQVTA